MHTIGTMWSPKVTQLAPRDALVVVPDEAYQISETDTPPPVRKSTPEEAQLAPRGAPK